MACRNVCRVCDRFIVSESVTFAAGTLTINIPEGSYNNCENYCLFINDPIPDTATINAPVVITIGTGTVTYPLVKCNCAQVTACGIRTHTKYPVKVITTATGGSFRILGKTCCAPNNNLRSINGTAPTTPAAG